MIVTSKEQLREKCDTVSLDEVEDLIKKLEEELSRSSDNGLPGIGLAAPQIGIKKRVAIVRVNKRNSVNLVNPRIVEKYDKALFEGEGCLSFPGVFESTMRYQEVVVENDVEPRRFVAKGIFAVAVQHECDHLDGLILPDFGLKKKTKSKLRPNDPCSCGSLKKYKKCCSKKR